MVLKMDIVFSTLVKWLLQISRYCNSIDLKFTCYILVFKKKNLQNPYSQERMYVCMKHERLSIYLVQSGYYYIYISTCRYSLK